MSSNCRGNACVKGVTGSNHGGLRTFSTILQVWCFKKPSIVLTCIACVSQTRRVKVGKLISSVYQTGRGKVGKVFLKMFSREELSDLAMYFVFLCSVHSEFTFKQIFFGYTYLVSKMTLSAKISNEQQ